MKKALIVQGGGFRTAFSAGVLDAFIKNNHNPFSIYVGVSGGAIAASYFIANQPRHCLDAIKFLSANKRYLDLTRLLSSKAIVDVEVFHDISNKFMPFDFISAEKNLLNKRLAIVMTDRETGNPNYYHPKIDTWQDAIIASCSFPFITKGKQHIEGLDYMDGAWSDPLPIEWAVKQGATDITIVRTMLAHEKISKSWLDLVGEIYYRNDEGLKSAFTKNHLQYNQSIDFINNPPKGITIRQVAPDVNLKAGVYTNSKSLIDEDYLYGFEKGNTFCGQKLISA
jgi:predicted patatin/cPLA2 family phospholipase